jgi:hypothetical protein
MVKDIFFRVDEELAAEIERRAKLEGRSVSNFVRTSMIAFLGLDTKSEAAPDASEPEPQKTPKKTKKKGAVIKPSP